MSTPILSVRNLTKTYGGLTAVKNCSFNIESGTMSGIIGPNGAGKTTLFNLLTGFARADAGSVLLDGKEITKLKPYEVVNLGMVRTFQVIQPYYEMTVLETLRVSRLCKRAGVAGKSAEQSDQLNFELLKTLNLEDKANSVVDDLTQGDLRLVDIGRALATEPKILFLDEPFSGLGGKSSSKLSELLFKLQDNGMTIIIIEHRLRELLKLVSHVMAINFGEILAKGSPEEIMRDQDVIDAYLGKAEGI